MTGLDLTKRLQVLETLLQGLAPLSIAFSGGFDSRFLTFMAMRLGLEVDLFHIIGAHMSASESAWARSWAEAGNVPFHEIELDPLAIPLVATGNPERCYACKHALFSYLQDMIAEDSILCDASTASDALAHRPGARALRELDVRSPLAEAMLTKDECRKIAAALGMDRPLQAARPCLLTRLPYHVEPKPNVLAQIDAMEDVAQQVFTLCYPELEEVPDFRIRLIPDAPVPYVLHVVADVAPSVVEALVAVYLAEGLPVPQVFAVQSISGYFDTVSDLS